MQAVPRVAHAKGAEVHRHPHLRLRRKLHGQQHYRLRGGADPRLLPRAWRDRGHDEVPHTASEGPAEAPHRMAGRPAHRAPRARRGREARTRPREHRLHRLQRGRAPHPHGRHLLAHARLRADRRRRQASVPRELGRTRLPRLRPRRRPRPEQHEEGQRPLRRPRPRVQVRREDPADVPHARRRRRLVPDEQRARLPQAAHDGHPRRAARDGPRAPLLPTAS